MTNTGIHTAFFTYIQQIEPFKMTWEGDGHKIFEFYCVYTAEELRGWTTANLYFLNILISYLGKKIYSTVGRQII